MTYTLITGASGGIGAELAKVCAENGQNVILVARREDKLLALKAELENKYGVAAVAVSMDLTADGAAESLFEKTAGLTVDRLINNAGFGDWSGFLDSDLGKQERMVRLNILTLIKLSYLYGRDMRQKGFGRIMNVASIAAFSAGPYMSGYYASKAYVLSFSQALSEELRGTGVTVTAVCPGPVSTGFESLAGMENSHMFSVLKPATARDTAIKSYRAMEKGKTVTYLGARSKILNIGSRLVPLKISRRMSESINSKPSE